MKTLRSPVSVLSLAVLLLLLVAPLTAAAEPLQTPGGSGCARFYQIQRGDTLSQLALRFGTTVPALAALNGISNPNLILAGQTICVRPAPPRPFGFLYTVRWGDTLSAIGRHYGWSVAYLAAVNHLSNPNLIYAGRLLLIPYHW
jgi:LysM repeat protein